MTENILEITDLCAGYDEKDILQKISLFIKQRSFVGIIGPNGSGKSTFLHVLARSLPVRTGNIALLGNPLQSLSFREFGKKCRICTAGLDIHFPYLVYDLVMMDEIPY
jgi:iron complex transport system ATP-binding protein